MKIAVASGKGGTGKTFVSTNIFSALRQKGYPVQLVDCDAEAPNALVFFQASLNTTFDVSQMVPVINQDACLFCGRCAEFCNYNAIFILPARRVISVSESLCHGCGACSVACRAGAISEKTSRLGTVSYYSLDGQTTLTEARMDIGVMSPVSVIKAAIKHASQIPAIAIFDAPPGTSCPFIHTVEEADYVILVTEPTPFGLSDLRQSVEALKKLEKPCGVIINKAGLGDLGVKKYLESEDIPLLLEIPFDKEVARIYSNGKIMADTNPAFGEKFLDVVEKIMVAHGNSSHQW